MRGDPPVRSKRPIPLNDPPVDRVARVVFLRRDIRRPLSYRSGGRDDLLGRPVVVPLRSDLTVGIVIAVGEDEEPNPRELKPIRGVITTVQPVPEDLLDLGKWVSRYYATPVNRVFEAIMPPRYLPDPEPAWRPGREFDPEAIDPASLGRLLEEEGELRMGQIEGRIGLEPDRVERVMSRLVSTGAVEKTLHLSRAKVTRKRLNYVRLDAPSTEVERFLESASSRQRQLLEHLMEVEGSYQKDLPDPLRRSRLLQRLQEEGLIDRTKRVYRRIPFPTEGSGGNDAPPELTPGQNRVLESVSESWEENGFGSHLLHGVTGSGKTEVYFRLIQRALERGQSALVLVPEITLATFQMRRFQDRFGGTLALLHSGLSAGERLDEWRRIREGEARVVLGVQSTVFAPLENPGLIVVDEEHDSSYKAGRSPRYHARDVAVMRARQNNIPVVLGSATPSLESYSNALRGRYRLHTMTERPLGGELPDVRIHDLRGEDGLLTARLVEKTARAFEEGRKAIWFLNRRGFSNFLLCEHCGETLQCNHCNVSLTLHSNPTQLRCHYCGYSRSVPERCEHCDEPSLSRVGIGTQKLAEAAKQRFEGVDVIRLDADTVTGKQARYRRLRAFDQPGPKLLLGTQMVTKGLDFEQVEFVGVVLVDTGLRFPDFRAGERTFQQLVQVCGRAGRERAGAEVLVQTYDPSHYAVRLGASGSYRDFFRRETAARKPLRYPPFARLINVLARGKEEEKVVSRLDKVRRRLPESDRVELMGPAPCGVSYVEGEHRWHLLARGQFTPDWRRRLLEVVTELSGSGRLVVDVDPIDVH